MLYGGGGAHGKDRFSGRQRHLFGRTDPLRVMYMLQLPRRAASQKDKSNKKATKRSQEKRGRLPWECVRFVRVFEAVAVGPGAGIKRQIDGHESGDGNKRSGGRNDQRQNRFTGSFIWWCFGQIEMVVIRFSLSR